ncbi:MAG: hypothetical protein IJ193_05010 [Bacilli bacterium]|nr:hypothetical protein [Bacilli bacterium]
MGFDDPMEDDYMFTGVSSYEDYNDDLMSRVSAFLDDLTNDHLKNCSIAKAYFPDLTIKNDEDDGNLLHTVVQADNRNKIEEAVKTLIDVGVDVNQKAFYDYNFIQTALYQGISEKTITAISRYALLNGLDPNHKDLDGDTVVHSAILSDEYNGSVTDIAAIFVKAGLNPKEKNNAKETFIESMDSQNEELGTERFTKQDKQDLVAAISNSDSDETNLEDGVDDYVIGSYMEKISPELVVPVDDKVSEMMVTLKSSKSVLLVGYERSGKSSIIQMLDSKLDDPFFQISYFDIISECNSLIEIQQNLTDSFDYCMNNKSIVVLEDIDKFVDFSSLTKEILRNYLRDGLKVVGTTNYHTYEKMIQKSDLNGYFYPTKIEDFNKSDLTKLMKHFCKSQKMDEEARSSLLYYLESRKSEESIISNFGLMVDVVERANAYALNDGRDTIGKVDIQKCVTNNDNFMKLKK